MWNFRYVILTCPTTYILVYRFSFCFRFRDLCLQHFGISRGILAVSNLTIAISIVSLKGLALFVMFTKCMPLKHRLIDAFHRRISNFGNGGLNCVPQSLGTENPVVEQLWSGSEIAMVCVKYKTHCLIC